MTSKVLANILVCSAFLTSCAGVEKPLNTTVCTIVADPARFLGQTVTISASWEMSYHYTFLEDDKCPKVGIGLLISEDARERKDVKDFLEGAYEKPWVDGGRRGEIGSFTGRIRRNSGEIPYLELDLQSWSRDR
jgi:hypothetical protein